MINVYVTLVMRPEIRKLQLYVLLAVIFLIVSLMFATTAKEGPKIFNEPPVASFTYEPTNPVASQTITFDASSSYDLDGSISSYAWDFGDGLPSIIVEKSHIKYAYTSAGTYVVTLTVWDDKRASGSKSETISVGKAWYSWPMFHQDAQHTGKARSNGIFTVSPQWEFDTRTFDSVGKIWASPVVAKDGTIYTVSTSSTNGGKVYALDSEGNIKPGWPFCPPVITTPPEITSTPAISPEVLTYTRPTRIYVGTHEQAGNNFFALDPTTGAVIWSLQVPGAIMGASSLTVAMDPFTNKPAIYFGTSSGNLTKIVDLGNTGSFMPADGGWQKYLSVPNPFIGFPSSPTLSHDNTIVYAGICKGPGATIDPCCDLGGITEACDNYWGYLVALNANDGSIRWSIKHTTTGTSWAPEWVSSPAVEVVDYPACLGLPAGSYETIFAGTSDQRLRAIREVTPTSAQRVMDFGASGLIGSCPAISDLNGDGNVEVIFGSADNNVYAVTFTPCQNAPAYCNVYWHLTTNEEVVSSASIALAPQPTVFIGSNDNRIYSINWEEATWPAPWGPGDWGVGYYDTGGDVVSSPAVAQPITTLLGVPGWVFVGSNDGKLYAFGPDLTSPATVTDLASSASTTNSITLTWTAPGDDGNTGTASEYDIRYSTSPITEANWNAATQCIGEPAPQPAGSSETFTVTRLFPGTTYYFALKTADDVSNWSPLSNVASGTTLAKLSPIPIPLPPPIS
jgi:outer membrane protein assembly factor BamB